MSLPGMPGGQYVATGLEHNETGRPRYDPRTHTAMTEKRFQKLEAARLVTYGRRGSMTPKVQQKRQRPPSSEQSTWWARPSRDTSPTAWP